MPYVLGSLISKPWAHFNNRIQRAKQILMRRGSLPYRATRFQGLAHFARKLRGEGDKMVKGNGAPERIRTSGLCLRRAALYPAELRVLQAGYIGTPMRLQ